MTLRNQFASRPAFAICIGVLAGISILAASQQLSSQAIPAADQTNTASPGVIAALQPSGAELFNVQDQTQQAEPPFILRTDTRRVVVDVVVTNPNETPASGLTQQDFKVLEDHQPQSIRLFEAHRRDEGSELPPAPRDLPGHTFVNLERNPASGPPVVVLIDFLNTSLTDQAYAHQQTMRFLEQKPDSTEVAIFTLGDSLLMLQGFTTDTIRLVAAMKTKTASPHAATAGEKLMRAQATLDAFADLGRFLAAIDGRKNLLWFSGSFDMMVLPKAQDADHDPLFVESSAGSPSPGPGAVVTSGSLMPSANSGETSASGFSSSIGSTNVLQDRLKRVAMALAVSQTAVYPVDVRGLQAEPGFSAAAATTSQMTADPRGLQGTPGLPTTPGGSPAAAEGQRQFINSLSATRATMEEIAEATGGHAFENTNGIAAAAAGAVSEGASYYTLVYAPSNSKFDGGLRTIHVALDKPGFKLSYRSAYYAVDSAELSSAISPELPNTLASAVLHGVPEAQGLVFRAQIDPDGPPVTAAADSPLAAKPASNTTTKPKKSSPPPSGLVQPYTIRLAILARQLQFTSTEDGRQQAALEVAVYAYSADGRKLGGTIQKIQASLPPAVYAVALRDGLLHRLKLQLPAEAASLRLAVCDLDNHRVGSLEIALPLPPAQQAELQRTQPR